jgi:hypothetical protein
MSKTINIPQGRGNHITEIDLPFYITIGNAIHVGYRGTTNDKVRRVYIDNHSNEISFCDYSNLNDFDVVSIQDALSLQEGIKIITESDFVKQLSVQIEKIQSC